MAFSRWPALVSWPGKTLAAISLSTQTNNMSSQGIPMVLLPKSLLKGPLVGSQKTKDPAKRKKVRALSYFLSM